MRKKHRKEENEKYMQGEGSALRKQYEKIMKFEI